MNVVRRLVTRAAFLTAAFAGSATVQAQLLNPGFETAGTSGRVFANWIDFGNSIPNISRASEAVRNGGFSAKMFGQFSGKFNVTGFFQDLPTTRDQVWDGSAYFQHRSVDAIAGGNRVAMNVEFRASNGDLLEYWTVDALTSASPTNVFIQHQIAATAPDDAVIARLIFLFIQPDFDTGAGHMDDASLASTSTSNLLINPGFEDFGGFGAAQNAQGWGQFPRFASNIFRNSETPRTGGFAGFMYGQFTGMPNFNGFYQSFAVSPGQTVDAEVFALHKSTDALAAGNFGFINLEFQDSTGAIIGDILTNPGITSASATNTYHQLPISGIAPPGTSRVRLVVGMYQAANGGGGVHFDDASIAITTVPTCCPGDADSSGVVNFADITDVLSNFNEVGTPGVQNPGDADCSGTVNFADITSVLSNFNLACN